MSDLEIIILLDESGSMDTIKDTVIKSINSFINEQKQVQTNCLLTLRMFNHNIRTIYDCVQLIDIDFKDYTPNGTTALHDAICSVFVERESKKNVIFVIVTDGFENASKKYNNIDVQKFVKTAETKHNWKIIYLAANQDAFSVGNSMNIDSKRCSPFVQSDFGFRKITRDLSSCISDFRRGKTTDISI